MPYCFHSMYHKYELRGQNSFDSSVTKRKKTSHLGNCYISSFKLFQLVQTRVYKRVSMGLTVSRKTAKNLAVRRKNERILTVSRKKMLTVRISNHKIRSRDL